MTHTTPFSAPPSRQRRHARWALALGAALSWSACAPPELEGDVDGEDHVHEHAPDPAEGERQMAAACTDPAHTHPKSPVFGKSIDRYASYVGQSRCDPVAKPGVVSFTKLVLAAYPCTRSYGIVRACNSGGQSEHKEGRAWDWGLPASHPATKALLTWLLATDAQGHRHAMARRFGIMYMISNRRMWRAYSPNDGWRSYSGSNPHTDHVHISFSWAGARKETSFWHPPAQPKPPEPRATNTTPKPEPKPDPSPTPDATATSDKGASPPATPGKEPALQATEAELELADSPGDSTAPGPDVEELDHPDPQAVQDPAADAITGGCGVIPRRGSGSWLLLGGLLALACGRRWRRRPQRRASSTP
ncbi:MAG: hypothetical protein IT371_15470 [Deltaproteobacteria bacterium]|nr:hypothetical protein [Deltaproteobacteria bacterium]